MVAEGNKEFTLFVTINLQSFERANIQRNICPDLNPFLDFCSIFRHNKVHNMKPFDIVTLTVNPALDKSTHFKGLVAEQKIRCEEPRFDAGGGGINVSKAISRLGGTSSNIHIWRTYREMLEQLIHKEAIAFEAVAVQSWTRESFVAVDDNTNSQYRFGFAGGIISEQEESNILETIAKLTPKFLVASGSLNEGLQLIFIKNS
jgi:6-phosphofructokinase 2